MSFTSTIKKELTQISMQNCCKKAELAAILRVNGLLQVKNKNLILEFVTENPAIARYTFSLCREVLDVKPKLIVGRKSQLKKNRFYMLYIDNKVSKILTDLKIMKANSLERVVGIDKKLVKNNCCKKSYLRGAFLANGSINHPNSTSYHLEITSAYTDHGEALCRIMNFFHLNPKLMTRKKGVVVYLKEGDKIGDLLNIIGAHPSLLTFENARIMKDMRNSVNRLVNCETANLNKTIKAAMQQVEDIKLIDQNIGLNSLPIPLREIANLRLTYPELNLTELGSLLPSGVKSKSTINHRFRKIKEIATRFK